MLEVINNVIKSEDSVLVIPREANLPIDREAKKVVARVSQAVVGVASITVYGDQLWRASGFIVEFDESSMIGTIFSCATVSEHIPMFPKIDKIRVYLFDGTSYDATIEACDNHWNLLVLSVSFGRAVKTMNMVEISENRNAMDVHLQGFVLQPHSASERLCPGDTIIGLGRQSTEPFGLQANCGVYSYERWADLPRFCHEMQKATFINTYASIGGPAINKNGRVIGMLFHDLDCTPFMPSNIILKWWDHFKKTRMYCRPTMRVFGVNLHNAQSSPWVKVPTSLYESYDDGFLVERVPRSVKSAGLQQKDLIITCNGKPVATSLQLFEILAENIGKMVGVTFIKAEDNSKHSIYLPVEETLEKNFYRYLPFHLVNLGQYPFFCAHYSTCVSAGQLHSTAIFANVE
ncbi:hypothetical protein CFC21_087757 [Triticum aestivum]|uniref:PDZ domain-containing protein n=2 Tax=Triticum aestivum TaxID=4565 RepID=A0A9R1IHZ4_WHEAT|nr:hypothetical protein CFC21_087757 [Triticum aestivum]